MGLTSNCNIDHTNFTDWKSSLLSNLMEENNSHPEPPRAPKPFHQHGIAGKTKMICVKMI